MGKKKIRIEKLKIPLDFNQTVLAALETPPKPKKKQAPKNARGK